MELGAPNAKQGQAGADPVAPIVEQSAIADPIRPTVEEPLVAGPTSPGGGAHDEGNPANMPGCKEAWTGVETSADPTRAGT